jgi:hypothetical protein
MGQGRAHRDPRTEDWRDGPRARRVRGPAGRVDRGRGPGAHWAANLVADPACTVTFGDRSFDGIAEELEGAEFAMAIRELILRYGTPAERLGSGPAFRIRPTGNRS